MTAAIRVHRAGGYSWQCPLSRRELADVLRAMRCALGQEDIPLDLTLTGDAFISAVNEEHLGCTGPTNILSFPAFAGPGHARALLVLSLDALERECLLYGQERVEHTLRLLAHGTAHLSGLGHGLAMDAAQEAAFVAGLRAV